MIVDWNNGKRKKKEEQAKTKFELSRLGVLLLAVADYEHYYL